MEMHRKQLVLRWGLGSRKIKFDAIDRFRIELDFDFFSFRWNTLQFDSEYNVDPFTLKTEIRDLNVNACKMAIMWETVEMRKLCTNSEHTNDTIAQRSKLIVFRARVAILFSHFVVVLRMQRCLRRPPSI